MTPIAKSKRHLVRHYSGSDKPSFTKEQLKSFLETARPVNLRDFCMFLVGFLHGMRVQEIANLRVSDVNFKDHTLRIRGLKNGHTSRTSLKALNGWDEETVLQSYLKERAEMPGAESSDALFLSGRSNPDGSRRSLDRISIFRLFQDICRKAALPASVSHPHVLRHTIGFLSVEAGIPLIEVQQLLRHRNINSTAVYCRPQMSTVDSHVNDALQKLF
jgi:integrase